MQKKKVYLAENLAMKIYDISQEVFSCQVYPGDPKTEKKILKSMEKGEVYNLTAFDMCAHNGTQSMHHFILLKTVKLWTRYA